MKYKPGRDGQRNLIHSGDSWLANHYIRGSGVPQKKSSQKNKNTYSDAEDDIPAIWGVAIILFALLFIVAAGYLFLEYV